MPRSGACSRSTPSSQSVNPVVPHRGRTLDLLSPTHQPPVPPKQGGREPGVSQPEDDQAEQEEQPDPRHEQELQRLVEREQDRRSNDGDKTNDVEDNDYIKMG